MNRPLALFLFGLIWFSLGRLPAGAQELPAPVSEEFSLYGEAWIKVGIHHPSDIAAVSAVASVAGYDADTLLVNVTPGELLRLSELGFTYVPFPAERPASGGLMAHAHLLTNNWDAYPTYDGYDSIMFAFQQIYPHLCLTHEFLTLASGRKLLVTRLTSPVSQVGGKPRFLYSSTMHGNETAGYILMLRLTDHLLSGYGIDPEATWILDNMELWICPLANPDGTYFGGNHTVSGAIRRNANNVDLNRNYPDPRVGANPDGHSYQPETMAFRALADTLQFVMGANLHSGAEVVNYPWDTWVKTHPDDVWWRYVSRIYADTVQSHSPAGFFTYLDNGITNGAAWYVITGGRQDYMNYFASCRELTLEVSGFFIEPVHRLPLMWDYHHRSLINFITQGFYGLRGTITDSVTGAPLRARVWMHQHDADSSHVWSDATTGNYYRPLQLGSHTVVIEKAGYHPQTHSVTILPSDTTIRDIQLVPVGYGIESRVAENHDFWYDLESRCIRFRAAPERGSVLQVYGIDGTRLDGVIDPGLCNTLQAGSGLRLVVLLLPDGNRVTRKISIH